ncbi:MAG: DUF6261 family protein [Tannerellaceae bacterium]|jgi:hypothetical protein|nr:DUF6261 family protein [Tannerellaceae bacterium]
MKKIKAYGRLLSNLINAQFVQFFFRLIARLTGKVEKVVRLVALWNALKKEVLNLDNSFKWAAASPETLLLERLDTERDGLLTIIFSAVKNLMKHAVDPAVKASAEFIYNYVKNFAEAGKMEYEAETAMITNFIQDLERPENAAHIANLGIAIYVGQLKAKNDEFQTHYETRYDARYAHQQSGSTGQLRENVVSVFNVFTTGVEGMFVTETDPAALADLQEVLDIINAEIAQFTIILDRHLKSKKKEDGKKDEETQAPDTTNPPAPNTPPQAPDTTNPPAPNTPPQAPDTTNPPAPDTPPQAPDTTVPPINPEDLNPPAAGE